MVGFEKGQHDTSEKVHGCAIVLRNCQTQPSSYRKKMEVVVKSNTTTEKSHIDFNIEDI